MKTSAGILLYRHGEAGLEVLIGHMGGPFWERKDAGAWSIPKGETKEGEETLAVAKREFAEELGSPPPEEPYLELGEIRQASGKRVVVFAVQGELDTESVLSNSFEMEWPRGSGQTARVPRDRPSGLDVARASAREVGPGPGAVSRAFGECPRRIRVASATRRLARFGRGRSRCRSTRDLGRPPEDASRVVSVTALSEHERPAATGLDGLAPSAAVTFQTFGSLFVIRTSRGGVAAGGVRLRQGMPGATQIVGIALEQADGFLRVRQSLLRIAQLSKALRLLGT